MYRARQLALDRRVAVKVLKSDHEFPAHERRQFGREARAVARLNHPHIASIYDFGAEENGRLLWLAMEFVEGESLRSIQRADPGIVRLLDLFEQLLGGLAAAHARGIIHRDLKPEHVLITQDDAGEESVKLVDFGLVEVQKGTLDLDGAPGGLGDEESEANYRLRATPRYAAPEVVSRGEAEPESDLYAVGVMLYEFLSDEPPFSGDGTGEIVRKHLEEPVPDLQPREDLDVPASLERCVDRLLSKDPSERFSSAAKLRDEIADLHRRIRRRRSSSSRGIFESKSDAITSLGQTPGDTNPPAQMFEGASEPRSAASPRVGPLVDRETERDLLERRIRKTVEQEEGQFALITGEPGIGKSRLVEWLRVRIEEAGWMQIGQGDYTPSGGSLDGVIAAVTDVTGLRKLPPHRTVEGARTLFDEFDLDERQVDRLCRLIGPRPEGGERLEAAREVHDVHNLSFVQGDLTERSFVDELLEVHEPDA
ncbi:MAG: protein kinase, partial [Bradymonadaceae bacterium]